eukprot:TRINITY_DN17914_c0_g1_i1.p1 TRINITY_DN17914_c0_g1~~TRINITY_DN17914_c0_g1_i1.p1  ORF type:complete len:329 (+),score=37.04 TRINITY_DN17914_c0_g1_i1:119-988(+)
MKVDNVFLGTDHAMYILHNESENRSQVYVVGSNKYGKLGTNANPTILVKVPQENTYLTELSRTHGKIVAGDINNHNLLVFADGSLSVSGHGRNGKLGNGSSKDEKIPVLSDFFTEKGSTVIAASASDAHSLVLTSNGSVYAFGSAGYGQLGVGNFGNVASWQVLPHPTPKKISFFSKNNINIVAVSAAKHHSLCLTDDGKVYTFGRDCYNGFMSPAKQHVYIPTLLNLHGRKITKISAGTSQSYLVTIRGSVYSFGLGLSGARLMKKGMEREKGYLLPTRMPIGNLLSK